MLEMLITTRSGERHTLPSDADVSVMEVIRDSGVAELVAMCGGCCACATCHVYVDEAWMERIGPRSDSEEEMVCDLAHYRPTSRLSCQIIMNQSLNGLSLTVAPEE